MSTPLLCTLEFGVRSARACPGWPRNCLLQLDGLSKSKDLVFVLAASNLPWELDAALLRRLEKRVRACACAARGLRLGGSLMELKKKLKNKYNGLISVKANGAALCVRRC
jgi:hypothetical protein